MQLTSDGHGPYLSAVEDVFGADVDFAQLIKLYGTEQTETRYSPAKCLGAKPKPITGDPDPKHISTSYIERQNLNVRMGVRRFTRLTNAFSKKLVNHAHAVALFYVWYNWCRRHTTTRVTPAQAAGLTDEWYDAEWLVGVIDAHLPSPDVVLEDGEVVPGQAVDEPPAPVANRRRPRLVEPVRGAGAEAERRAADVLPSTGFAGPAAPARPPRRPTTPRRNRRPRSGCGRVGLRRCPPADPPYANPTAHPPGASSQPLMLSRTSPGLRAACPSGSPVPGAAELLAAHREERLAQSRRKAGTVAAQPGPGDDVKHGGTRAISRRAARVGPSRTTPSAVG